MADIRIHELPEAAAWDGVFPQDKSGGVTEKVSVAQVITRLQTDFQPKDSDLTAIAALTTTAFGRSLLTLADQPALLTYVGAQPLENQRLSTSNNVNFNKLQIGGVDRITNVGGFVGSSLQVTGATASKLARFDASKNLVSYDLVAADIPTLNQNTTGSAAKWTTPRTLTIGATGKTIDGSSNVSWSLAEIGALPAANVSGVAGQIAAFTGANTVASDAGLTRTQSGGKTYQVTIGDGTATSPSSLILKNPTANASMFEIWEGANKRFQMGKSGTNFLMSTYTTGGVGIDDPVTIALASGGEIKLGGSTSRPINIASGSVLQHNGTTVLNSSRALQNLADVSITKGANDNIGVGSYLQLADAATPTKGWALQLGASNTLDAWNYASGVWAKRASISPAGNLSATGALTWGGAATIPSSDYVVQGNGAGSLGHRTTNISGATATPTQSGFYDAQSPADGPQGAVWTHMIRSAHTGNATNNQWMFDIAAAFGLGTGGVEGYYVRTISEGSTPGWRQLWHSGSAAINAGNLKIATSAMTSDDGWVGHPAGNTASYATHSGIDTWSNGTDGSVGLWAGGDGYVAIHVGGWQAVNIDPTHTEVYNQLLASGGLVHRHQRITYNASIYDPGIYSVEATCSVKLPTPSASTLGHVYWINSVGAYTVTVNTVSGPIIGFTPGISGVGRQMFQGVQTGTNTYAWLCGS